MIAVGARKRDGIRTWTLKYFIFGIVICSGKFKNSRILKCDQNSAKSLIRDT